MKKEIYKVTCPKHILFGDPMYFNEYSEKELKRLVVDYNLTSGFDTARLVLTEESPYYKGLLERRMKLYVAPHRTMETYLEGMMYSVQKLKEKEIGVDTARYLLSIDGREVEVNTKSDGWCGDFDELYHYSDKKRCSDAVILTVAVPEDMDFSKMKQLAKHLFRDIQRLSSKQQKKDDSAR